MNDYRVLLRTFVLGCGLFSAACGGEAASDGGEIESIDSTEQALTLTMFDTGYPGCKPMTYGNKEVWGCRIKLPVGPSNGPAPWGICGIAEVSGTTGPGSSFRIVVGADGF